MEKDNELKVSKALKLKRLYAMIEATNEKIDILAKKIFSDGEITKNRIDDCNKILKEHASHLYDVDEEIACLRADIDILEDNNKEKDEKDEKESEGHYWWIPKKVTDEFVKAAKLDNIQDHISYDEEEEEAKEESKEDIVNHPSHYTDGKYEVINFIEDYNLPFHVGNTVKYICRAGKKDEDKYIEDLKKAEWYIFRWYNYTLKNESRVFGEYCVRDDRINVTDFCKDKKLGFDLTKVINFIVLGRYYDAYLELHSYIGYLEELGKES